MSTAPFIHFIPARSRVMLALLALALNACTMPTVVEYTAFENHEYAKRVRPAQLYTGSADDLLQSG